ncbi:MAG: hypothetical protein IT495_14925 [Gammaproteobacteria bacterium]|nr:hypothetical protein [Gammaproteobacteria bacterium]
MSFGAACYVFILVLDPYQNVPFSPPLGRAPVDTNQRFAYPPLARRQAFDSAVLGTSTSRLLDPGHLDPMFHARFVNLAMNGATAWEQTQMGELFLRHHPQARYLLIGVDLVWCETGKDYERYTFRLFPAWMYDENRWNDLLYLFNDKALEQAVRELEYLLGRRESKYRRDGYRYFLPDEKAYDLAKARRKIYGREDFNVTTAPPVPTVEPALTRSNWVFPTHTLMRELLAAAPAATQKVLFFVPYHEHVLRRQGKVYAQCKGRLIDIAAAFPNTHVVDYMRPSVLTREDRNYWDALHYGSTVARAVEAGLAAAIRERRGASGYYRYLTPADVDRAPTAARGRPRPGVAGATAP